MEHHKAELRNVEPGDAPEDDPARFLRELRRLRDGVGLGHAELAARAHYPFDTIRAAEAGPALPDLPVLSAYVRACGGIVAEWEERWRSLTRSPALTLLPVRPAGSSEAATAGARVGSSTPAADGHDPDFILAALGRVADGIAAEPPSALPSPAAPSPSPVTGTASAGVFARTGSPGAVEAAVPGGSAGPESAASPPSAKTSAGAAASGSLVTSAGPAASAGGRGFAAPVRDAGGSAATLPPRDTVSARPVAGPRTNVTQVPPRSALGRRADSRRSLPPKPLVAAVAAVILCVVATILALFT